jgi:hypothetical protein
MWMKKNSFENMDLLFVEATRKGEVECIDIMSGWSLRHEFAKI